MPRTERNDIWFDSADGQSRVAGYFWHSAQVRPFCVVQVAHGMCEHMLRYAEFADALGAGGAVVCGNDHLGHGATAADAGDLGYFTEKHGRRHAMADLAAMNRLAREAWPGLPVIVLGHSMGSFFARQLAADEPELMDGLILSGTGGPNPLAGFGIGMTGLLARLRGPRHRSGLLYAMSFGGYLRRIDRPATPYDWLSRDEAVVRAYAADPLCTFRFTVNGFHELYQALHGVSSPRWATRVRKDMPVLMLQGDADPVGDYGRGTARVRDWLRGAGVKNLEYILYEGGRHEMLNEVNREEVYGDILDFLVKWWHKS